MGEGGAGDVVGVGRSGTMALPAEKRLISTVASGTGKTQATKDNPSLALLLLLGTALRPTFTTAVPD